MSGLDTHVKTARMFVSKSPRNTAEISNHDLNNILTAGFYACIYADSSNASYVANYPVPTSNGPSYYGNLLVFTMDDERVGQILFTMGDGNTQTAPPMGRVRRGVSSANACQGGVGYKINGTFTQSN